MTSKERIRAAIARQPADRIPLLEIAYWDETVARWRGEGLPKDYACQSPIHSSEGYRVERTLEDYFGMDRISVFCFDNTLRLPERMLEESEEYVVRMMPDGMTAKFPRHRTGTPLYLDWAVKTPAAWAALRDRLFPAGDRLPGAMPEALRAATAVGAYTVIKPEEPCQSALYVLGEENCLVQMAENPDFVEDVIRQYAQFQLGMLEILEGKGYRFDALWHFSDLCYKNGMLFSPRFYRERVLPHLRPIYDWCHARGMQVIYHCDGYVARFLPLLIEAGVDCVQPLEVRCGNDVRIYKPQYGERLAFFGNISADTMAVGGDLLVDEVRSKVLCAKEGGGYIFHSDHSIPPTVSLENYRLAVETARKYGRY